MDMSEKNILFFKRRYTVNLYFLYLAQVEVEVSSTNLNCKSLLPLYCNATMQIKTHLATFLQLMHCMAYICIHGQTMWHQSVSWSIVTKFREELLNEIKCLYCIYACNE